SGGNTDRLYDAIDGHLERAIAIGQGRDGGRGSGNRNCLRRFSVEVNGRGVGSVNLEYEIDVVGHGKRRGTANNLRPQRDLVAAHSEQRAFRRFVHAAHCGRGVLLSKRDQPVAKVTRKPGFKERLFGRIRATGGQVRGGGNTRVATAARQESAR